MPSQAANQDRITTNVWLTRAASKGLFNAFSETNATALSPAGTAWAFGALSNYAALSFTNWLGLLNGQSPTTLVGQQMVLHLTGDDIYIAVDFTIWGSGGSGGFAYQRSTAPGVNISGVSVSDGQFTFNYAADSGMDYVIESSSNLVDWASVSTNAGSGSVVSFFDTFNTNESRFYRVEVLSSP